MLNFINKSKKRCAPFILYLNFINASGKRCDQQEWNMFKIHFTIPKFLQVIEPYRIMSLVFWKWNSTVFFVLSILLQKSGKRCAPFFAYLNFNNKSRTESRFILLYLNFHKSLIPTQSSLLFLTLRPRCDPFVPCWNFINKSETEPRFILPYLNFYNSLISTRSCLWFLKVKQRCDLFFPYFINESETEMWFFFSIFKFNQWEWNRVKIHFTIPKLLQVIDPLRYGFIIFHIWTLSTTMKAEMWSVFAIFKIYQQEWNRVKIIFTMRKLLHVIGSLPDVYGETETWLVFFHT